MRRSASLRTVALTIGAILVLAWAGCGGGNDEGDQGAARPKANAADRAFAQLMVPHHEAALSMAELAQKRAEHPQVRTLAGNIVRSQTAEIAQLRKLGKAAGVKPEEHGGGHAAMQARGPAASALGLTEAELAIEHDAAGLKTSKPFDRAFIDAMTPHHEGAIRMAKAQLARGAEPRLKALARQIVAAQTKEVGDMSAWRAQWYGKPASGGDGGAKEPPHSGAGH